MIESGCVNGLGLIIGGMVVVGLWFIGVGALVKFMQGRRE